MLFKRTSRLPISTVIPMVAIVELLALWYDPAFKNYRKNIPLTTRNNNKNPSILSAPPV